ncbi:MAG: hypothetical protein ABSD89_07335 [Halobacteriota archaeon]
MKRDSGTAGGSRTQQGGRDAEGHAGRRSGPLLPSRAAPADGGGRSHAEGAKLRTPPFEPEIIERCRRRANSMEEALLERRIAGIGVRRAEDMTEASSGTAT